MSALSIKEFIQELEDFKNSVSLPPSSARPTHVTFAMLRGSLDSSTAELSKEMARIGLIAQANAMTKESQDAIVRNLRDIVVPMCSVIQHLSHYPYENPLCKGRVLISRLQKYMIQVFNSLICVLECISDSKKLLAAISMSFRVLEQAPMLAKTPMIACKREILKVIQLLKVSAAEIREENTNMSEEKSETIESGIQVLKSTAKLVTVSLGIINGVSGNSNSSDRKTVPEKDSPIDAIAEGCDILEDAIIDFADALNTLPSSPLAKDSEDEDEARDAVDDEEVSALEDVENSIEGMKQGIVGFSAIVEQLYPYFLPSEATVLSELSAELSTILNSLNEGMQAVSSHASSLFLG